MSFFTWDKNWSPNASRRGSEHDHPLVDLPTRHRLQHAVRTDRAGPRRPGRHHARRAGHGARRGAQRHRARHVDHGSASSLSSQCLTRSCVCRTCGEHRARVPRMGPGKPRRPARGDRACGRQGHRDAMTMTGRIPQIDKERIARVISHLAVTSASFCDNVRLLDSAPVACGVRSAPGPLDHAGVGLCGRSRRAAPRVPTLRVSGVGEPGAVIPSPRRGGGRARRRWRSVAGGRGRSVLRRR
jgi:hypothetical protein